MTPAANAYSLAVIAAGSLTLGTALIDWRAGNTAVFLLYCAAAAAASCFKIPIPGIPATVSPGFVLVLMSTTAVPWNATAVLCALSAVVQCLWTTKRTPTVRQVAFNSAALVLGGTAASFGAAAVAPRLDSGPPMLVFLACGLVILYFINTTLVSAIVCLVQSRPLHEVFRTCNFYSFPAYLVGTLLTGMMMESSAAGPAAMFLLTGLLLPAYTFYRSWLTSRARA